MHDFLHPDRVVIGGDDAAAAESVAGALPRPRHRDHHHRRGLGGDDQVRRQRLPGDEDLVRQRRRRAVRSGRRRRPSRDRGHRIRSAHRTRLPAPGPGWGGSCFPKDSRALVSIAAKHGYDFSMMRGVIAVNDEQRERMVRKIVAAAGRDAAATDRDARRRADRRARPDVQGRHRRPPRVAEPRRHRRASRRSAPRSRPTTRRRSPPLHEARAAPPLAGIELCADPYSAAAGADVVVVLTEWPEFGHLDLDRLAEVMRGRGDRRHPQHARSGGGSLAWPDLRRRRTPLMAHVLLAGGAGFIGSHLADRLLDRGDTVVCVDDLSTGSRRAHQGPRQGRPLLVRRPRHHAARTGRGDRWRPLRRRDQPRQPGVAACVPGAADRHARRRQHRHPGAARDRPPRPGPILPRLDERGLRRPARASAGRERTGATSTRSASARSTTRRSGSPKR